MRTTAGAGFPFGFGQARKFSKARYGSPPDFFAFLRRALTVCTVCSTLPLDLGCLGLQVVCLNSLNSLLENWGPFSVITVSGIPFLANIDLVRLITAALVASGTKLTSG